MYVNKENLRVLESPNVLGKFYGKLRVGITKTNAGDSAPHHSRAGNSNSRGYKTGSGFRSGDTFHSQSQITWNSFHEPVTILNPPGFN